MYGGIQEGRPRPRPFQKKADFKIPIARLRTEPPALSHLWNDGVIAPVSERPHLPGVPYLI